MTRTTTLLLALFAITVVACGSGPVTSPSPSAVTPSASAGASASTSTADATATPVPPVQIVAMINKDEITLTPAVASSNDRMLIFTITNTSSRPRELFVVRSDLATDKLPVSGKVIDISKLDVIARTPRVVPGGMSALSLVAPKRARYLVFSNQPGDYAAGLIASFEVK